MKDILPAEEKLFYNEEDKKYCVSYPFWGSVQYMFFLFQHITLKKSIMPCILVATLIIIFSTRRITPLTVLMKAEMASLTELIKTAINPPLVADTINRTGYLKKSPDAVTKDSIVLHVTCLIWLDIL